MTIFIIYASTGAGHLKAAEAIYNCFKQNNQNLELKLIDALQYSNFLFKRIYAHGYAFLVGYLPWLWALIFYITGVKPLGPLIKRIHLLINILNTKRFITLLVDENPGLIICTHFLPSEISAYLKEKQKIKSKLFTVITDFGVHPFWISGGIYNYIVAAESTKEQLASWGIEKGAVKVLGIPIDTKFLTQYDKAALSRKFGINRNKFTVLVVTGSFGIGPIEKLVDLLHNDAQVLVVCARNKELFLKLKIKNYPGVKIFGFVEDIQELMAASDIIITKPGGLTISEILTMELTPLFISTIPGQEAQNAEVLEEYGIGVKIKDVRDIKDIVLGYKANPDKINKIKENMRKIKKPFAAQELYCIVTKNKDYII